MMKTDKNVHHPVGFCVRHGLFTVHAIAIGAGSSITIQNCAASCPTCGRTSEILPGRVNALKDGIELLIDPSISISALAALKKLVEKVRDNEITPEVAKSEAEKIAKGSGKLFDLKNWNDQAKATLYTGVIAAITAISVAKIMQPVASPTTLNLAPAIERVIERPAVDTVIARLLAERDEARQQLKAAQEEGTRDLSKKTRKRR